VLLLSGGTEANNLALRSHVRSVKSAVLITSELEHPSVSKTAAALAAEGACRVVWLRAESTGQVSLSDLESALRDVGPEALVAVQAINHETGVVQPLGDVFRLARQREARVHVDAVQAFGRTRDIWLEADSRALAGHKLRGPKGIGALLLRPGGSVLPSVHGGAQERGLRAGTVDPAACAGLAVAARHALSGPARYAQLGPLRDRLEQQLLQLAPKSRIAGGGAPRAHHVTNWVVPGVVGPELVAALSLEGLSVSAGSACSAGTVEPSPVLTAMLGAALGRSGMRFSLGEGSTAADVDAALAIVARVLPAFLAG
jgi:cysteine desulfurase